MNNKQLKARVAAETLTDGSIVFNVMVGDEAIAHPPSQQEAQELCDDYNRRSACEMADVQHEEVILSCVKRNKTGTPVQVLAEINGNVLIGGKFYVVGQHCWLNLKPKR